MFMESWFCDPAVITSCSACDDRPPDDSDRLSGRPAAVVQRRDDDGGADGEQDDEGTDPEDPTTDPLFDLATGDHPHLAERVVDGQPAPDVATGAGGVPAQAPGPARPVAAPPPGSGAARRLCRIRRVRTRRLMTAAATKAIRR